MNMQRVISAAIAVSFVVTIVPIKEARAGDLGYQRPDMIESTIDLPDGFAGEGVAAGPGRTFFAGSRTDGRVAIGNLREGTTRVFVSDPLVPAAIGLKVDERSGLLLVAGGATGQAAVYDAKTGAGIAALTLTTAASFINDVVVTRDAAYFTNSRSSEIYRVPILGRGKVGGPLTIPLSGPAAAFDPGFNLNGIEATRNGKLLVVVNSATGALFTIDPVSGASAQIDLGGASVPTGDGILFVNGRTLLVLQNGNDGGVNQIAVIKLDHRLTSGRIVRTVTSPLFETATTIARSGSTLLAVNAQFAPPPIDPEPEVVLLQLKSLDHR